MLFNVHFYCSLLTQTTYIRVAKINRHETRVKKMPCDWQERQQSCISAVGLSDCIRCIAAIVPVLPFIIWFSNHAWGRLSNGTYDIWVRHIDNTDATINSWLDVMVTLSRVCPVSTRNRLDRNITCNKRAVGPTRSDKAAEKVHASRVNPSRALRRFSSTCFDISEMDTPAFAVKLTWCRFGTGFCLALSVALFCLSGVSE